MNKRQIKEIKISLSKLCADFQLESFQDDIGHNTEIVDLSFPGEDDYIGFDIDYIKICLNEIESLQIKDDNKVTTDTITQKAIYISSNYYPYLYLGLFEQNLQDGIILRICDNPLLIGLACTKTKEYNKYNPPCSRHLAVEIIYPTKETRLPPDEEDKMLSSYFFEIANSFEMAINYSSFHLDNDAFDEEQITHLSLNKLENYNYGMDLFIQANESITPDLKYLLYYKIFEYFAPIYSKIEAYDILRKKLDNVNLRSNDPEYLASFFDLSTKYSRSLRDKDLIKSLLNNTFDLIDVYQYLPLSIRKQKIKSVNINYKTNKDSLERIIDLLGDILYSTRNQIVHAKSNYVSNGLECAESELEELNHFMHKASYSIIKWYNRLPNHQK